MSQLLDSDGFIVEARVWPTCYAGLRIWCQLNPAAAVRDAFTITTTYAENEVVVPSDTREIALNVPENILRRLFTPMEQSVFSPDGELLHHCDGVPASTLVAAIMTFASESYLRGSSLD